MRRKRPRFRLTIRGKLALAMTALPAVTAVVLVYESSSRMNREAWENLERGEAGMLRLLSYQMAPALEFQNKANASDLLSSLMANPDVR